MIIALAEDDPGYAEMLEVLLRARSHRTVLAPGLDSLRRLLHRSPVDFVIMAASMGDDSPENLILEIRQQQPDVPIIVLMGDSLVGAIVRCFAAGADDCVRKPFHPSELVARLEAITKRAARVRVNSPDTRIAPVREGMPAA